MIKEVPGPAISDTAIYIARTVVVYIYTRGNLTDLTVHNNDWQVSSSEKKIPLDV